MKIRLFSPNSTFVSPSISRILFGPITEFTRDHAWRPCIDTGFIATLEYGLLRGYHFHALIFLNGHLVQDEVRIAWRLGEHWANVICEGQGRYWNCNAQEYAERGIGVINYYDGDKRVALVEKVASYLTKTDFWVQFQPGGKTLFKGLMPEPDRPQGSIRRYGADDLGRVRFIKAAQRLGFSLDEVADLLKLQDGTQCDQAREQGHKKLADVRARIADLKRIEAALADLVQRCSTTRGRVRCPLINALQEG